MRNNNDNGNCHSIIDRWLRSMDARAIESCHDGHHRYHYSPLQLAVALGHHDVVQTVAQAYVDQNAHMHLHAGVSHELEATALSLAIESGHYDIVNCLLALNYPFAHNCDTDGVPGSYYLSLACSYSVLRMTIHGIKVVTVLLQHLYNRVERKLIKNGTDASELARSTMSHLSLILELGCKPVMFKDEVSDKLLTFLFAY